MKRYRRWLVWLIVGVGMVWLVWSSTRPAPIDVDIGLVSRGPLVVTVNEDGRTRIKERYVVSAPLAGRTSRIQLDEGDAVEAGKSVIASIEATDPQLLDERSRTQAEALVKAAVAAKERAAADLQRAQSADEHARIEWKRTQQLFEDALVSEADAQAAQYRAEVAEAELKSARMTIQVAAFELEQARAALLHTQGLEENVSGKDWQFKVRSPIDGQVLSVSQESATIVAPGTPLIEVGDPADLEVIVDVLSPDAVKIKPGARVIFEHWGGDEPLEGRVRLVEPAAFTKFSALGVEEQRVWVVIDFASAFEERQTLGDGYRVEARIVVWESDDVIQVPTGALFREDDDWAVFVERNGRAELRVVQRGQSDALQTEIVAGLQPQERVILHPSERVSDGALVVPRS